VAGGSPSLWTDIIMQNRDAVLKSLREFSSRSQELYNILEKKDAEALNALLTKASSIRNALSFQSKNYESN
jgi:prephenate dehydrogenase